LNAIFEIKDDNFETAKARSYLFSKSTSIEIAKAPNLESFMMVVTNQNVIQS
jgi:hypothetical protein